MIIRRHIYNTAAILIAIVLVFGGASDAFAMHFDSSGNAIIDPGDNFNTGVNFGSDPNAVGGTSLPITFTTDTSKKGVETQSSQATNPSTQTPSTTTTSATSTPNGTIPQTTYKSITSNVLGCSVGQLLASVITTGITTALNGLTNLLAVWTGAPNHDAQLNGAVGLSTAANTGFQVMGVYVGVSLDSIAYCIVNSILEYIANSTIQWANSGFNGSPAFVQNPDRFFQGLADQQASQFISALAYNTSINGRQMNVCSPFRTQNALQLASNYGIHGNSTIGPIGFASYGSCGLTADQITAMKTGGAAKDVFAYNYNVTLNSNNNAIDSLITADRTQQMLIQQQQAAQARQLSYNSGGYRSTVVCSDPKNNNSCNITVPASHTYATVQNTLNAGQNRLLMTTKFDQVVSSIVNNLIRVGLNKLLTPQGLGSPAGTYVPSTGYTTTQ